MSHLIADITSQQISKVAKDGFILASKIKKGSLVDCIVDNGNERYASTRKIINVTTTPSGKYIHLDVGADEPIEVLATEYIRLG